MLDFDKLITRFRQFGSWRLVWQYIRMGVLWTGVCALVRCALKGWSLKAAYPVMTENVDGILIRKYRYILDEMKLRDAEDQTSNDRGVPKIVWFSWLQGIDQAPDLVKVCLASQRKHLPDYEFRVFDLSNYQQWIELPEYIVRKYKKGLIPAASFSDLLHLSVLQKYGGVWMDATVFCSGFGNEKLQGRWDRIMQSELTVFRYFKRGAMAPVGLSNWFIAAVPHQIVISSVLDMLLAYWKDYNCLVDYYIFHLFLGLSLREFPMVEARMPRENSYHSILLGDALGRTFHQEQWQDLINHVSIHTLNYRKVDEASKNPKGYYWHIMKEFE